MGNISDNAITVKLLLNGKSIKNIIVKQHDIYEGVSFNSSKDGVLQLIPSEPGLEIYTFTFGG